MSTALKRTTRSDLTIPMRSMVFVADDGGQMRPSRPGMGSLTAVGGYMVDAGSLSDLEHSISSTCVAAGFPEGEPFKWSPSRDMWMWSSLAGAERSEFFLDVTHTLAEFDATAIVVMLDTTRAPATASGKHVHCATDLLMERIHINCKRRTGNAILILAKPGGGAVQQRETLQHCATTAERGTRHIMPTTIAPTVTTAPLRSSRAIQAADIVVSCTVSRISGEANYSPSVFKGLLTLFDMHQGRTGGIGVKLHPDYCFANLYHWILGDDSHSKNGTITQLPIPGLPYSVDPNVYYSRQCGT